jgi:hypothetical protein
LRRLRIVTGDPGDPGDPGELGGKMGLPSFLVRRLERLELAFG